MLSQWIFVLGAFFVSMTLTAFLFSKLVVFSIFRLRDFSATASVMTGCLFTCVFALPFLWNQNDFVSNIGMWGFLAPLIGLGVIYYTGFVCGPYATEWAVLIASLIGVFGGDLYIDFISQAPVIINKLCTVLVWFLFSIGIRTVAALYPVLQIQTITISAGLVLLYVFGGAPFMVGFIASTFLGASYIAYLNYSNQNLCLSLSPIIGYFIGWFGIIAYNELFLSSYIVLTMFCIVEMVFSLLKKMTFLKKYKDFSNNSFLVHVYKNGLPSLTIIRSLWMLSGMTVLFAVLQVNGVNKYSVPAFIFVITLWQFYKMIEWKEEKKSWKEKKEEFVAEMKETVQKIKTAKDTEDKKASKKTESKKKTVKKSRAKVKDVKKKTAERVSKKCK